MVGAPVNRTAGYGLSAYGSMPWSMRSAMRSVSAVRVSWVRGMGLTVPGSVSDRVGFFGVSG